MRAFVATWVVLAVVTAIALVAFDPRYYVMPGRLPEGLPVLGSDPVARVSIASAVGLIVGGIVVGMAALAQAVYLAATSNKPLEPTPKDGAAQRQR